jgi:hypothetical protein
LIVQQIANPGWTPPNGISIDGNPNGANTEYQQFRYSYQLSIQNASGVTTNINVPGYIETFSSDPSGTHLIIVSVPSLTSTISNTSFIGPSQNGPLFETLSYPQLSSIYDYNISNGQLTPVLVNQAVSGLGKLTPVGNPTVTPVNPIYGLYLSTETISGAIDPGAGPGIFIGNPDYTQSETPIVYSQPFTYTIPTAPAIFSPGDDKIPFGELTPTQVSAINAGADLYHALGGSDTITLPDLVGNTYVLSPAVNVAWDPSQTFVVGALTDTAANTDAITGNNGNYNISIVGSANVGITITGNGSSTITAGSGTDTITLNGTSNVTINGGAASNQLYIGGSGGAKALLNGLTSSLVSLATKSSDIINVSVTDNSARISQGYVVGELGQATMSVLSGASLTTDYFAIGDGSTATGR